MKKRAVKTAPKESFGQKFTRLSAIAWAWCLTNPKLAIAGGLLVLASLGAVAGRETIKKTWMERTATKTEQVVDKQSKKVEMSEAEVKELTQLRVEVRTLRTTASRYRKLTAAVNPFTGLPLLDKNGEPIFNTDEGDSSEQETTQKLADLLTEEQEKTRRLSNSLDIEKTKTSSLELQLITSTEIHKVPAKSAFTLGLESALDVSETWGTAGYRFPLGPVHLGTRAVLPVTGPAAEYPYSWTKVKLGAELELPAPW